MRSGTIAIAVLAVMLMCTAAGAAPMLILCGLHGDAWLEGGSFTLSEIKIESANSALVPFNYESFAEKGYGPSALFAETPQMIWDKSFATSMPATGRYELGFIYDDVADGGALQANNWTFQYDIGNGLEQGSVGFYIPEPTSLALLGMGALALLRSKRK